MKDRQFVVNEEEAANVRRLFAAYLKIGNIRQLKVWADQEGIVTKRRTRKGQPCGGKPYWLGNLADSLSNCIYIGQVRGRGTTYKGQHQPIIDPEIWQKVQASLRAKAVARKSSRNICSGSLFVGKLYDETGERFSPTSTTRRGRRYQYYVTRGLLVGQTTFSRGWRLPAKTIESAITQLTCHHLATMTTRNDRSAFSAELNSVLEKFANCKGELDFAGTAQLLSSLVAKVVIFDDRLSITLRSSAATATEDDRMEQSDEVSTFEVPVKLQRRGVEVKLITQPQGITGRCEDPTLIRTIALAWAGFMELQQSLVGTCGRHTRRDGSTASEVSRLLPLAFLAPKIVKSIVIGTQPAHLTSEVLKRFPSMPSSWKLQQLALDARSSYRRELRSLRRPGP